MTNATEIRLGPFAPNALCNFRRIGSRWMLEFRTGMPTCDDEPKGHKALIGVETIDGLQENSQGHTLVYTHTPTEHGVKPHDCHARTMIAIHPYELMRDHYEGCMFAAEKWRKEQELRAEDSDSIDAQLRRVNRNWMDLDKGPSDSSLKQIIDEAGRMRDAAKGSLQASEAKTKRQAAQQAVKKG